jgi:hypothetical protein
MNRHLSVILAVLTGALIAPLAAAGDGPVLDLRMAPPPPGQTVPVDHADAQWTAAMMQQPSAAPAATAPGATTPDPSVVAAGQAAFARSCTNCHDEQRSLQKSKTYAGWLATVQRMASKEGADISSADIVPIASYLVSVRPAAAGTAGAAAADGAGGEPAGGWTFAGTVSTLHRSASDEYLLENPGFFADVWATASYTASGPWQATVTACTSCHARDNNAGNAFSLELVEGSATLDLRQLCHGCKCEDGHDLLLKAGRFIVPFGAYAAMADPGAHRTVTHPLMFNMGRRVLVPGTQLAQPVLPAPFSDEGIDFIYRRPVGEELMLSLDLFAMNGLQGTGPTIFNRSRAYFDNNEEPAVGGRLALGGDFFRLGTSVMSGNLVDQQVTPSVYYTLTGADATAQITDRLRFYFEYAMRRQNSVSVPDLKETTYGIVTQLEFRVWECPDIGILVRYDTLEHRDLPIGDATLERFTWGLNIGLPGGSLLMLNHERWFVRDAEDTDVFGVRWSVSL